MVWVERLELSTSRSQTACATNCATPRNGGGGAIRTHEAFQLGGFQDRWIKPLSHASVARYNPRIQDICPGVPRLFEVHLLSFTSLELEQLRNSTRNRTTFSTRWWNFGEVRLELTRCYCIIGLTNYPSTLH